MYYQSLKIIRCHYEFTFIEDGSTQLTSYSNIFLRSYLKYKNVIIAYIDISQISGLLSLNNNFINVTN